MLQVTNDKTVGEKEGDMVSLDQVERQLKQVGCNFQFWGRSEVKELRNILAAEETIAHCVNGWYANGFAMLCATDHRLLLIDHKPMFLSVEDIRYDMIAEIDYNRNLLDATINIITPSRKLVFTSWSMYHLREVLNYTQSQIMEIRRQYMARQFQQTLNVPTTTIGGLATQPAGGMQQPALTSMPAMPINPSANGPLMLRRRRVPKFY